jgi:hypothetical protein
LIDFVIFVLTERLARAWVQACRRLTLVVGTAEGAVVCCTATEHPAASLAIQVR